MKLGISFPRKDFTKLDILKWSSKIKYLSINHNICYVMGEARAGYFHKLNTRLVSFHKLVSIYVTKMKYQFIPLFAFRGDYSFTFTFPTSHSIPTSIQFTIVSNDWDLYSWSVLLSCSSVVTMDEPSVVDWLSYAMIEVLDEHNTLHSASAVPYATDTAYQYCLTGYTM